MATLTPLDFKVGGLIIIGLVAAIFLVLVSDRIHFEHDYRINAYLADANGLRPHSPVTLSGIRIGEVEGLEPVTDARGAIRAVLKLNAAYRLPANSTVTISSSGIFGDSFLAFSEPTAPSDRMLPTDGSADVMVQRGFLETAGQQASAIMASVKDLLAPSTRDDVKRLMHHAADLAGDADALALSLQQQNQRLGDALVAVTATTRALQTQVATLTAHLDRTLGAVDQTLATLDRRIDGLGASGESTLAHSTALLASAQRWMDSHGQETGAAIAHLDAVAARLDRIAAMVEHGDGLVGQLIGDRALARDANDAAIDLSHAAGYVADHPSALIFGIGSHDLAQQRQARELAKERRAFEQGLGHPVAPGPAPAAGPPAPAGAAAPASPASGTPSADGMPAHPDHASGAAVPAGP